MLNTLQNKSMWGQRLQRVLAACLLAASGATMAAPVTVNLCATTGSVSLPAVPSSVSVAFWGYASGACPAAASAPGGPVITVTVGDVVTVNLQNSLSQATGLLFQGQGMVPDTTGAAATTGITSYTFTATNPGTFLYEAAPLLGAEYQTAMGLHGAFVVKPVAALARTDVATVTTGSAVVADTFAAATDIGATVSGAGIPLGATITAVTAGASFTMSAAAIADAASVTVTAAATAYADASTTYQDEAALVLSEIDPALNNSAAPATFDMRKYAPRYFLINGKNYPNTDPIASAAGRKVLLRYVNAGAKHHSMAVLGLRQIFVAKDASTLPQLNHNVAAETLAPGQTGDAIVTVPAAATTASKFAVYDASLALRNSNATGFGGMLTFVNAGTGAGATGPATSGVALTPNPTAGGVSVALSATVTGAAAAEYFIGATGANGTGTTMPVAGTSATATIPTSTLAALASGKYTIYVHARDAATVPAWGGFSSATLNLDKLGPTTSGLTRSPSSSNGAVNIALSATGNDSVNGGSNVTAAEYTIDSGAAVPMTLGGAAAPIRSLTASIPAPFAAGTHTIAVRSQDALGNWGLPTTITFTVVVAPPAVSAISVAKTPNNGTLPLSATQPVVRVTATMTSTGSTVAGAEGFIDTIPASTAVRGFPFVPSDGAWGGAAEIGYADIPLSTINALAIGSHTIRVRGQDANGNWTTTMGTVVLVIDKTAPTITSATLTPSTVGLIPASTTLAVVATDNLGVVGGQYWIDGTATPPANAIAFTGTSVAINTSGLAGGTHTVRVRVQDAATNWSAVSAALTLTVVQAVADTRTITANTNATQNSDTNTATNLLANDLPGGAGRTTMLATAPVRTGGTGTGTIAVACPATLGTVVTPAIGGSTVCTNGAYRVTLTGAQAAKRGTFQFTYTETLNGATSTATVTINVN